MRKYYSYIWTESEVRVRGFPEAVRAAFRDDNRDFATACINVCVSILHEAYSEGAVAFSNMIVCKLRRRNAIIV